MGKIAMLVTLLFALSAASQSSDSQRADVILTPSHDLQVPTIIRGQLADAADVEANLNLPNKDVALEYDTVRDNPDTADFMNNEPHVVLVRGERVIFNTGISSLARTGPIRFHGMALLARAGTTPIVVCAFTLGGDSAETFFVFLGEQSKGYKVIATLRGEQAQIRINSRPLASFELWKGDGFSGRGLDAECVWCPKYYKKTMYEFRQGKLEKLESIRTKRGYDPDPFFETPFILIK